MADFDYRYPATYGALAPPQEEAPWEPSLEELQALYMGAQQAPPPPGFLDRLAMGLQGVQGPAYGPGAALAGFAQGFSGARMGAMGQRERALARQNQANLAATQAHIQARLRPKPKTAGQLSAEAEATAYGTRKGQIAAGPLPGTEPKPERTIKVPETGQEVPVSSALGQWIAAGKTAASFREPADNSFKFGATTAATIRDDIRSDPDVKDFIIVRDNYERVKAGAKSKTGIGDLAIIFAYMKVLDPTSVVRETEYKNAAEAIGKIPILQTTPKRWIQGDKLTQEGRDSFLAEIEQLYDAKLNSHLEAVQFYSNLARAQGLDPNLVLRDFTAPSRRVKKTPSSAVPPSFIPDGRR